MRFYSYTNFYLSSMQHGIQTQHVLGEMFLNIVIKNTEDVSYEHLYDWLKNHKTTIVLNGGNQASLEELFNAWDLVNSNSYEGSLPLACFHEEKDALNGTLTSVGVILPESVYKDGVTLLRDDMAQFDSLVKDDSFSEESRFSDLSPTNKVSFLEDIRVSKNVIAASLIYGYKLAG